jgi:hypothetical protein
MPSNWSAFLAAQVGASAGLLGLVFVSLSINLAKIIEVRHLPNRALESLVVLLLGLVVASLGLAPGQPARIFGSETLALVTCVWIGVSLLHLDTDRNIPAEFRARSRRAIVLGQSVMALWWAAALGLCVAGPSGAALLPPSFLLGYILAILNAWILLVEVNR